MGVGPLAGALLQNMLGRRGSLRSPLCCITYLKITCSYRIEGLLLKILPAVHKYDERTATVERILSHDHTFHTR